MIDNQNYIGGEAARFCKKCGTKLYDNIPLEINRSLNYICPKCTSLWRVFSFILICVLIFAPLPDASWVWIIKVIALIYMAYFLQTFIVCLPYFLKLKK
jgi:hypothetical protein